MALCDNGVVMVMIMMVVVLGLPWGSGGGYRRVEARGGGDRIDPMDRVSFLLSVCSDDSQSTDFGWGLHYLLDKVVPAGTAPGLNSSDHNVNPITNGDGM
ncbi:hypothetical protein Tco_0458120 [Tanacetum coccineum]